MLSSKNNMKRSFYSPSPTYDRINKIIARTPKGEDPLKRIPEDMVYEALDEVNDAEGRFYTILIFGAILATVVFIFLGVMEMINPEGVCNPFNQACEDAALGRSR